MREDRSILTPTQVGQYIKGFMDRDRILSSLLVRGELSNCRLYPSGHHYFTLKDGESALRCVMFRGDAATLRFRPEDGMQVIAAGRVSVFPRDGQYQLYCTRLTSEGTGDLYAAFEQMKARLQREGLFDQTRKKEIPAFPKTIALVTSPVGKAVRDMLRILKNRWPLAQVRVLPVRVQGEEAPREIAAALQWASRQRVADLIITGRGGGSMEDLWAFNEELVARAIAACEIPVISAVGHEPDVTIADYAADLRAATPSHAAEKAVPDQREVRDILARAGGRLEHAAVRRLAGYRQRLERLARSPVLTEPEIYFQNKRLLLDAHSRQLAHGLERCLAARRAHLGRLASALDAMSPLKVLGRGYAIPRREDGRVLVSAADAVEGERLWLRLCDGVLPCRVEAEHGAADAPDRQGRSVPHGGA